MTQLGYWRGRTMAAVGKRMICRYCAPSVAADRASRVPKGLCVAPDVLGRVNVADAGVGMFYLTGESVPEAVFW